MMAHSADILERLLRPLRVAATLHPESQIGPCPPEQLLRECYVSFMNTDTVAAHHRGVAEHAAACGRCTGQLLAWLRDDALDRAREETEILRSHAHDLPVLIQS